jgi:NifU-like protein involved in Fe-S cluster formation
VSELYTRPILRLALASATYPRLTRPTISVERRALLCGSHITLDMTIDADGRATDIGFAVAACAIGQAAAALLAADIAGRDAGSLNDAVTALENWLGNIDVPPPDWLGIEALAPARTYPARHGAALLPFAAAADALSSAAKREAA